MKTARRGFLKTLAAVPLVPSAAGAAPDGPASQGGTAAVAQALAEAVKREFGAHLDARDLAAVEKELALGLERGARLRRAAGLGNADEPVARFEARPPAGPERGGRR